MAVARSESIACCPRFFELREFFEPFFPRALDVLCADACDEPLPALDLCAVLCALEECALDFPAKADFWAEDLASGGFGAEDFEPEDAVAGVACVPGVAAVPETEDAQSALPPSARPSKPQSAALHHPRLGI